MLHEVGEYLDRMLLGTEIAEMAEVGVCVVQNVFVGRAALREGEDVVQKQDRFAIALDRCAGGEVLGSDAVQEVVTLHAGVAVRGLRPTEGAKDLRAQLGRDQAAVEQVHRVLVGHEQGIQVLALIEELGLGLGPVGGFDRRKVDDHRSLVAHGRMQVRDGRGQARFEIGVLEMAPLLVALVNEALVDALDGVMNEQPFGPGHAERGHGRRVAELGGDLIAHALEQCEQGTRALDDHDWGRSLLHHVFERTSSDRICQPKKQTIIIYPCQFTDEVALSR